MAKLVLKGHATRGKEVIDLLKMLGAYSTNYTGTFPSFYYWIDDDLIISSDIYPSNSVVFTLEEFLDKYPYKVGDKVIYDNSVNEIIDMKWNDNINTISYGVSNGKIKNLAIVEELQPYKEETMEEIEITNKAIFEFNAQSCDIMNDIIKTDMKEIKINIPKGYEFFGIDGDNKIILTEKQSQYPTTYEECCKIVNASPYIKLNYNTSKGQKYSYDVDNLQLYENLRRLIICRDAYWKIAGEQMKLGKSWEPDWGTGSYKYCLINYENQIIRWTRNYNNAILAFPTEEMRDTFYKNFKDLIEECKELL